MPTPVRARSPLNVGGHANDTAHTRERQEVEENQIGQLNVASHTGDHPRILAHRQHNLSWERLALGGEQRDRIRDEVRRDERHDADHRKAAAKTKRVETREGWCVSTHTQKRTAWWWWCFHEPRLLRLLRWLLRLLRRLLSC